MPVALFVVEVGEGEIVLAVVGELLFGDAEGATRGFALDCPIQHVIGDV
jgi:hypothetical protein